MRGILRKGWARHPIKLEFIKRNRIPVPNPNPNGRKKTVFGMVCNRCKGEFPMPVSRNTKSRIEKLTGKPYIPIEINHRTGAGTLTTKEDLGRFAANLLFVTFEDLEALCRECHGVVSYSQRYGVTEEEAELEKEVIRITKDNATCKTWLREKGEELARNATLRRDQVREVLKRCSSGTS